VEHHRVIEGAAPGGGKAALGGPRVLLSEGCCKVQAWPHLALMPPVWPCDVWVYGSLFPPSPSPSPSLSPPFDGHG
jgi:hypothetical protein